MNSACFMLIAFILMVSCEIKQGDLNKSLRWESDHEVILIYVKGYKPDTSRYDLIKKELDTRIAAKLEAAKLGEPIENVDTNQKDLLFMVPKEYQKALEIIIKETRLSGNIKKFVVFEREYVSETEWTDKQIYSE